MVIHYVKDVLKKLEDIDKKLSVSLEKDEIQTLGLKLRFYTNEINHYKNLLKDLVKKVEDIQKRYGFITESEANVSINKLNDSKENNKGELLENSGKDIKAFTDYINDAEILFADFKVSEAIEKLNNFVDKNLGFLSLIRSKDFIESYLLKEGEETPSKKFCKGYLLMKFGFVGSAINLFESLLEQNVDLLEINLLLADCYFEKEVYNKALFYYKKSYELNSKNENAILGLCKCNLEIGNANEVIKLLDESNLSSDSSKILKIKAFIRLQDFEYAKKEIENINTDNMQAIAFKLLGEIKESTNDILSAIDFYEQSLLLNPLDWELRYKVGEIYFKNNAIMLAKKHLNFIIKNMPESKYSDKSRLLLYGSSSKILNKEGKYDL